MITIKMREAPTFEPSDPPEKRWPSVGEMWFAPWLLDDPHPHVGDELSPNYLRDWKGKRPPLIVRLPGVCDFLVDGRAWRDGKSYGDGWVVTGTPPLITVSPSINVGGIYHGYIRDGIITPDVEGRTYTAEGCLIRRA